MSDVYVLVRRRARGDLREETTDEQRVLHLLAGGRAPGAAARARLDTLRAGGIIHGRFACGFDVFLKGSIWDEEENE